MPAELAPAMLNVRDLSVLDSHGRPLLTRLNLAVEHQQICAIQGPAGAGKTAFLESIVGLRAIHSGQVSIGEPARPSSTSDFRATVTVAWSRAAADDRMTLRENVQLVLRLCLDHQPDRATIDRVLRETELPDRLFDRKSSELSPSQRTRMWLAIARLRQTPITILDEPDLGSSTAEIRDSFAIVQDLREVGMTFLFATRSVAIAAMADRVCLIENGRDVAHGSPGVVFGAS